jgi:chromosome segregation ATPase
MGERPRLQMSPEPMEKMEKMKAQREEIRSIGEAARNETDPVKKEAQVAQLRAKLNEAADQMQADAKKRLEKAEQEIPKLKERMAEFEANRAVRIEEQIKRILAGEPLRGPEGKRPDGAAKREHKKDTPPPAE